jgi:hypothetical protein
MAIWTIRTHYKKSCEQIEYFYNTKIPGARIIVRDGFRRAEFNIFTSDDEFPAIEFDEVPGGDGKRDSLDLFSLIGDNIDSTDLVEMFDGGCWGDVEIEGIEDEEELERLQELIQEHGAWSLEDEEDSGWYLSDTECWVWGPLEIEDEAGNVRIIIADDDGNVIDFVEEE